MRTVAVGHRRSIRLPGYDYSQAGAYFVTVCVEGRECRLGGIVRGEMRLNMVGEMVQAVWQELPAHYPGVDVDTFVVMPNHVHGIILIGRARGPARTAIPAANDLVGAGPGARPDDGGHDVNGQWAGQAQGPAGKGQPQGVARTAGIGPGGRMSLSDVVHRFKSLTTARYRDGVKQQGWPRFDGRFWQRNYHEHIVRDAAELDRIRRYIAQNPANWARDTLRA